jgi:hypothetical protein
MIPQLAVSDYPSAMDSESTAAIKPLQLLLPMVSSVSDYVDPLFQVSPKWGTWDRLLL